MAAVGGCIEDDVFRPAFDAALKDCLQRFVTGVAAIEGQIVAEQDCAPLRLAQEAEQLRQGWYVFAVNFNQRQAPRLVLRDIAMHRLDQGTLAGAARAPQQGIVRRQALCKPQGVFIQRIALPIDALQQFDVEPVHLGDGLQIGRIRVPDEGIGGTEIRHRRRRRRQSFETIGDPGQQPGNIVFWHRQIQVENSGGGT